MYLQGLRRRITFDAGLFPTNNDRLQEFVILALLISFLNSLDGITALLTIAYAQCVQSNLNSLPSLITIHSIVSPNNSSNLTNSNLLGLIQQLLHIPCTRLWIGIASITEKVYVH